MLKLIKKKNGCSYSFSVDYYSENTGYASSEKHKLSLLVMCLL